MGSETMRICSFVLPALLAAAVPATASARDAADRTRVGVGASVNMGGIGLLGVESGISFAPLGTMNLHVPIRTAAGFRLEPEIGYTNFSDDHSSWSAFRFGLGLAWSWMPLDRTLLYAGPKFGLTIRSTEYDAVIEEFSEEEDATDFWIGAAVGGEGFVTDGFSLGLEAQLSYVDFGESDDSAVSTNALFFGRFYFN